MILRLTQAMEFPEKARSNDIPLLTLVNSSKEKTVTINHRSLSLQFYYPTIILGIFYYAFAGLSTINSTQLRPDGEHPV